jgi:hypothetical protein
MRKNNNVVISGIYGKKLHLKSRLALIILINFLSIAERRVFLVSSVSFDWFLILYEKEDELINWEKIILWAHFYHNIVLAGFIFSWFKLRSFS